MLMATNSPVRIQLTILAGSTPSSAAICGGLSQRCTAPSDCSDLLRTGHPLQLPARDEHVANLRQIVERDGSRAADERAPAGINLAPPQQITENLRANAEPCRGFSQGNQHRYCSTSVEVVISTAVDCADQTGALRDFSALIAPR